MSKLKEIADWLDDEALERMKAALGRKEGSQTMRGATAKELREAKKLAEQMSGRKMTGAIATTESATIYGNIQDKIAAKLETEARQLSAWADFLRAGAGGK